MHALAGYFLMCAIPCAAALSNGTRARVRRVAILRSSLHDSHSTAAAAPLVSLHTQTLELCPPSARLQVEALIADGIAPGATDRAKHSGAHFAASREELEVLQLLHAKGVDLDADDANGRSPLHHAAAGNHEATVTFLISKGSWIDATDEDEMTPLHHAAAWRAPEAAARLLKAGAKPQLVNELGLRAIGAFSAT